MKTRTKALWIFLGTIAITVGSLLIFIQSKTFADAFKHFARRYLPTDFGVQGDFSELSVKLIPPGVVIKNPAIVLKEQNPIGLPAGTKIDAQFIDVTFQFFQLLTGAVTINAFAIHGATLNLDLDEKFFASREKALQPHSRFEQKFSWDSLFRFNFRSVSLIDSQIDVRMSRGQATAPIHVQAFAKEVTVGRNMIDNLPSYDLAVDLQKANIETVVFKHTVSQFQASIEISSKGAAIRNLGIQEGELNFHTNGQVRGNILNPKSLRSDISYIVRGPLPAWLEPTLAGRFVKLPKDLAIDGNIAIEGKLTGDLLDLAKTVETKAEIQFDGLKVGEWKIDKATLKGDWKSPRVILESADLHLGEGVVRISKLEYDMNDPDQMLSVKLGFESVDFRRLMGSALKAVYPLHMLVNGNADAEISLGKEFSVEGNVDLAMKEFSFDNQKADLKKPLKVLIAVKELGLKSRFEVDGEGVRFDQTELNLPRSHLKAAGKVDGKSGFDIDVNGHVNMADLGKLSAFDIAGDGDLHWTIKGKKPDVVFGFDADMKESRYLNLNLGNVKGRVTYNDGNDMLYFTNLVASQGRSQFIANGTIDLGETDAANMTIQVPQGTIQDFAAVFSDFLKKSVPWYPYELSGQMNGVIRVSGKTPLDQLSVEGDMEMSNVDFMREMFHSARVHAGYRRGAYIAENIFVRKKTGSFKGNLFFGADGLIRFDLKSEGMSTLDVDSLASFGIPYRAPLSFETSGTGKLGSLKSNFKLWLGEGLIKTAPVPPSEFYLRTENGRVMGEMSIFSGELKGKMDVGWEKGSNSSIDLEARHFDFQPMLLALNMSLADDPDLDSELSGLAHLRFQTGALSRLSGNLALNSYILRRHGYALNLDRPVAFEIQNGNYEFSGLKFSGEGTSLSAKGSVREGKINYSIGGNLNLGFFEFLVQDLASVHGSAAVDAQVYGRADSPNFTAKVNTTGADLRLRAIEQPFEDLKFKVDWQDSEMRINDIGAKFAGGLVRGLGTIDLYPYKVPDFDIKVFLDNPKVKVYPVTYARMTGKITMKGSELPYKVKGSLNVAEALIKENFNLSEGARVLRSSKFLPQKKGGSGPGDLQIFDLDVDLVADRNVFLKNDLFDAELKGNIKVVNSIQAPRLLGQTSVLHGKLLFKDNFFTIQSGNVKFSNPAALDPEFDLTGQTDVKGYKIVLVSSGTVSNYNLSFQSQPPLSEKDIVSLLTLGVTSSGFQSISRENRDAYSRDELYGLLFSQSGVNKGLQQKYGLKVRVDQSANLIPENAFRARSSTDVGETVSPKVVVQKEVTKNLNASVGSTVGLGENQERDVGLEYDLPFMKNFSVKGTYEDLRGSQASQSRTSVGADLKYKIRFK